MKVVVTGGGTIAPIDDVRFITNRSSGRLSAAITESCLRQGASVWHIHGPSAELPLIRQGYFDLTAADPGPEFERLRRVRHEWKESSQRLHLVPIGGGTVAEYARELHRVLVAEAVDVVFLAMAVSDFEPEPFSGKLDSDPDVIAIHGRRTRKVIQSVRDWAPDAFVVGFKLLSRVHDAELIDEARAALRINRADMIVANDLQTVLGGRHTLHVVGRQGAPETLEAGPDLADRLVARVFACMRERAERS